MEEEYIEWDMQKEDENMSIDDKITLLLKKNGSYLSVNEVLEKLFDNYNISMDNVKNIILNDNNKEKCRKCSYALEYNSTFNKYILKCYMCNNGNDCDNCINIQIEFI